MKDNRVIIEKPKNVEYEPAPWWANPMFHWDVTCQQGTGAPFNQSTITTATTSKNPNCTITAWNKDTPKTLTSILKNNLKSAGIDV